MEAVVGFAFESGRLGLVEADTTCTKSGREGCTYIQEIVCYDVYLALWLDLHLD